MGKPFYLPIIARAFLVFALSLAIAPASSNADENPIKPPSATRAKLISDVPVEYPEVALQNRLQGRVVVLAWVDESGEVKDMWIAVSSGYRELDTAALRAVLGAHFVPATRDGKPIAESVRVPITFSTSN
jgi:periplasmic protein TonB